MSDRPRKIRVARLDTIGGVVTEMGKVYREARRGNLETLDATRLCSVLAEIRRGLETNASSANFLGKQCLGRDMRANEISGPIPISAAKRIFLDRIAGIRERLGETACEVD